MQKYKTQMKSYKMNRTSIITINMMHSVKRRINLESEAQAGWAKGSGTEEFW